MALSAILGDDVKGLSANTIVRLKEQWEKEYDDWTTKRNLEGKRYVYMWADGVYFNVRLTDSRPCILVIIAAGEKFIDGEPEKEELKMMAAWENYQRMRVSSTTFDNSSKSL